MAPRRRLAVAVALAAVAIAALVLWRSSGDAGTGPGSRAGAGEREGAEPTLAAQPAPPPAAAGMSTPAPEPATAPAPPPAPSGPLLRGRVVREDGTPVAGADVAACDPQGRVGSTAAWTSADGTFSLERSTSTGGRIVAYAFEVGAGFAPLVGGSESADVGDVILHPTPQVEGRVVYTDGSPVGGVWLWADFGPAPGAAPVEPCSRWRQGHTRTRDDGTFRMLFPAEGLCTIRVQDAAAETRARTGDRDAKIVVKVHRIRVRVVDAKGATVTGLSFSSMWWSVEHLSRYEAVLAGRVSEEEAMRSADRVEAGGGLESGTDLFAPPRSAWIFAVHPKNAVPGEAAVLVPDSGNESELVVALPAPGRGGRIRVTATDDEGAPAAPLRLEATTPLGSGLWSGTLPPDGIVGPIRPGRVLLTVRPSRGGNDSGWVPPVDSWLLPATATTEVRDGAVTELRVGLTPGGRVRVVLRPPRTTTRAGSDDQFTLRCVPLAGGEGTMLITGEGSGTEGWSSAFSPSGPRVSLTLLPAGDYRLEVFTVGTGRETPLVSGEVRIRAREITDVTLDLPAPK